MMMATKKATFEFTIHFATINTDYKITFLHTLHEFTIHFATINTHLKRSQSHHGIRIYNTLCYY